MIRKTVGTRDIKRVEQIYNAIMEKEAATIVMTDWKKKVYPTQQTAFEAHENGELFVLEDAGEVVATAIINQKQVPEYAECAWQWSARNSEIMVIHTLAVHPEKSGKGYGAQFIAFYENYARENGCSVLRLDTNVKNVVARGVYQHLGYREAGVVSCVFNGIADVQLVCLEKKLY